MYRFLKRLFNAIFDGTKGHLIQFFVAIRDKSEFRHERKKNAFKYDNEYKKEIKKYWRQFKVGINPMYHFQYAVTNNKKDVRYIPDYLYYTKIMDYYSNRELAIGVNDKNYYNLFFKNFKQPRCVFRRISGLYYDENYKLISADKALSLCKKYDELIFKPSIDNGSAYGIVFWNHEKDLNDILSSFNNKDFIVQEILKQHKDISKFNPTSLNTIRVTSFIFDNKVNILGATLRMGVNNSRVDNACAGGIFTAVDVRTGKLKKVAYNAQGKRFDKHPNELNFSGNSIPNFDKLLTKVKETHEALGHFRLISWDTTIDEKGEPVLIEANFRNGCPFLHQYDDGPLFGELTDQVLSEVFGRR